VATRQRPLVERGVLQGYVLSSYSARRLGLATTGNAGGVHNLIVKPTAGTLADLIKDCDEAFVVGELLGQGVNTVTGDYSRGAAGFLVSRGEIVHPVSRRPPPHPGSQSYAPHCSAASADRSRRRQRARMLR